LLTKRFFIFLLISITLSSEAFTQTSPQFRRLPPSLERELKLRKGGKARIIGFVDTLKAQSLIAQSIRDSSAEELDSMSVRDTAIIMIDSSVSLTDKEWLDSMLAELPEYRMTPAGIRFQYPAEILVETKRKVVPQDTTLPSRMDPVTKEDLPLYDESPMPRPLTQMSIPNTSIELGAGAPYIPRVDIRSLVLSNEKSALELNGKYRMTTAVEPAMKQYWKIGAGGNFLFPNAFPLVGEQVPELDIRASTGASKRLVISQFDSGQHTLSQTNFGAEFTIGSPSQLKLRSRAELSILGDDAGSNISEDQGRAELSLLKDISDSYRLGLDLKYSGVSTIHSKLETSILSLVDTRFLLEEKGSNNFRWQAGISYVNGNDATGSTSLFSPIIGLKLRLSSAIEIGAAFEPAPKLIGLRELTNQNIFYSPVIAAFPNDALFPDDQRRIVTEPVHINVFANYFLSLEDELHAAFRFIRRNDEPIFRSDTDKKSHPVFIADPANTARVEFEAGGNLLLFGKDKLRASLLFRSAYNWENLQALPFEPTAQIQAAYQFGNISEKFTPTIEFIHLERVAHTFTFINLEARYEFSPKFQLKFRAENIFGNAGDFWTGYDEYPRSAWVSVQYSF